jgi:hypothetical protein
MKVEDWRVVVKRLRAAMLYCLSSSALRQVKASTHDRGRA